MRPCKSYRCRSMSCTRTPDARRSRRRSCCERCCCRRCMGVSQVQCGRGGALLSGTRAGGKRSRVDCGGVRDRGGYSGRARSGSGLVGSCSARQAPHAGRGQAISRAEFCGSLAATSDRPAHRRVRTRQSAAQQFTRRGTPQRRVSREPEETEASGAELCLDQTLGRVSPGEIAQPQAGGVAVSNRGGGLQFGAHDALAGARNLKERLAGTVSTAKIAQSGTELAYSKRRKSKLAGTAGEIIEFFSTLFTRSN